MATIEKIRKDLEKTDEKISMLQARRKVLEGQLTEAENLETVQLVKAVRMTNKELAVFLKAYASGQIKLPDNLMAADSVVLTADDYEDDAYEE